MADSKITALAALTAADPVNDMFPVVDVSDNSMAASGTTKRISVNNILGASGTATLAAATITGAATVGTTLGVTGVSTFAAGTALLPALTTTGDVNTGIYYPAADTFAVTTGGTERYRVDSSGNVGVGVTPVTGAKLAVAGPIVRDKGSASLVQNIATTVATLPGEGLFIAYAYANASNPAAFTSYAVILADSSGSRVVANNGTQITITTSTYALQVTQIFTATLTVQWSFVQIG